MSNSKSSFNENQILESMQSSGTSSNNSSSSPFSGYNSNSGSNSGSNSFVTFFKNISWKTWILIIIIFAILGFNIFIYLAKGTQWFANFVNQITNWFSGLFGNNISDTAKQTINVSATGAKAGIDVAANTTTDTIDYTSSRGENNTNTNTNTNTSNNTSNISGSPAYTSQPGQPIQNTNTNLEQMQADSLNKVLNNSNQLNSNQSQGVQADDSYSSIQSSGKSGWCLIGEDQGIRSCMQVGVNDQCMSGDIFPTNDVCVNPNLRA